MRFIDTRKAAERKAKDATKYTLAELVGQEADEWSQEERERNARESAEIMLSERQEPFRSIVRDRALTRWQNGMRRVSKDILSETDDETLVLCHDIWPNRMDKWECRQILDTVEESDIPNCHYTEAWGCVTSGIQEKLTDY